MIGLKKASAGAAVAGVLMVGAMSDAPIAQGTAITALVLEAGLMALEFGFAPEKGLTIAIRGRTCADEVACREVRIGARTAPRPALLHAPS